MAPRKTSPRVRALPSRKTSTGLVLQLVANTPQPVALPPMSPEYRVAVEWFLERQRQHIQSLRIALGVS